MLTLIILILLIIFLYLSLNKILAINLKKVRINYDYAQAQGAQLFQKNTELKQENEHLRNTLEKTITLYETAKEISKSLEQEKVFSLFRDEASNHLTIKECKFIQGEIEPARYKDYLVLPLEIEKKRIGYLLAYIVKKEEYETFYILAQQFFLGMKRALLYQKIQELAIMDSLTGTFSRRYYLERFQEEIKRSKKFKLNFAFLMIDVDHFKGYNDHYGHLSGDAILKEIASGIRENIRQIDFLGRYGGEEFSIILTETDREGARFAAERIRRAIEDKYFKVYDEGLRLTISIGISAFPADAQEQQSLIDKADQALYRAKEEGRNRVCVS
ncbi:MAG: GGDEF domain-containing protein [Candidatus Omnitrophica bacterium]|nr:GGDEF domain-containing protein [Candidatus Omnitrophota bacterium]